jgi:hypothetical protein
MAGVIGSAAAGGVPYWEDEPDLWDLVHVSSVEWGVYTLPGIAEVDVKLAEGLDIQKPKGHHGAAITDVGAEPAEVTVKLTIYEQASWIDFQKNASKFRPKPKGALNKMGIAHPKCALWGIQTVMVKLVGGPKKTKNGWVVDLDFVEFYPPPRSVALKTSISFNSVGNAPTPAIAGKLASSPSTTIATVPAPRKK